MSKTHIAVILDMSASMAVTEVETREGLRTYIKETRKDVPDALFSLTIFDTRFEKWIDSVPINSLKTKEVVRNYKPRGWTALYDAIGHTIGGLEKKVKRSDKAIVVIMTDGEENSSIRFRDIDIKSLITRLQNKGNWTFVFLGANIDSWAIGRNLGFYQANTADYSQGRERQVMLRSAKATTHWAASPAASSATFYEDANVNTEEFKKDENHIQLTLDEDDKVAIKSK